MLLFPLGVMAQEYQIKVKLKNAPDTQLQLAYYFADKQYVQDTTITDKSGVAVFEGEKKLPGGLYLIILPGKYFDILITDDQKFTIEADTVDIQKSIKFKGSNENSVFYEYQNHIMTQSALRKEYQQKLENATNKTDSVNYKSKINTINQELDTYWRTVVENNKGTLLASLLNGMNGEPPEGYSEENFFNHINFADERLLRSPIIHRAVRMVLARNLNNHKPVSNIVKEIDMMAAKAKANDEVYHYVLNHYLNFFNTFPRIGMNEVFIHIVEKYYSTEENDWMDEKSLKQINKRAEELKSNLPGQKAPDLMLEMPNEEYVSLHQMEAKYTFVLFWTVGCGHCEDAIESLKSFKTEMKDKDIAILAVYTKTDKTEWVKFIEMHNINWINGYDPDQRTNFTQKYYVYSTPIMYMLDENKIIKALRVGPEQIKDLLEQLIAQKDKL